MQEAEQQVQKRQGLLASAAYGEEVADLLVLSGRLEGRLSCVTPAEKDGFLEDLSWNEAAGFSGLNAPKKIHPHELCLMHLQGASSGGWVPRAELDGVYEEHIRLSAVASAMRYHASIHALWRQLANPLPSPPSSAAFLDAYVGLAGAREYRKSPLVSDLVANFKTHRDIGSAIVGACEFSAGLWAMSSIRDDQTLSAVFWATAAAAGWLLGKQGYLLPAGVGASYALSRHQAALPSPRVGLPGGVRFDDWQGWLFGYLAMATGGLKSAIELFDRRQERNRGIDLLRGGLTKAEIKLLNIVAEQFVVMPKKIKLNGWSRSSLYNAALSLEAKGLIREITGQGSYRAFCLKDRLPQSLPGKPARRRSSRP